MYVEFSTETNKVPHVGPWNLGKLAASSLPQEL
jgi:hypothetical protein